MKLALQYNKDLNPAAIATLLRGADPLQWLQEIGHWNLAAEELDCYILPQSVLSVAASGLFVVFKNAATADHLNLLEPYTCLEEKLYIPVRSQLNPQLTGNELNSLLLWDLQVFHPVIGLVGFEKKDKLKLSELFSYHSFERTDWSYANPGLTARPPFAHILIRQPDPNKLIESIKNEIGEKSLKNIPSKEGDGVTAIEKFTDAIKFGLLKGLGTAGGFIGSLLPQTGNNSQTGGGILQKLQNWILKNMEELERKRNDEISRLLNLFDEDSPEALQYALPLDSPYLNRGSQAPSSSLSKNDTGFNLGKLGGGLAIDGWNLGDRYNDLRSKYLRAAQKEIERKDFRKAAYVYAHLLGDYHSAANVLEQGEMYREAASLHKDHLKNLPAAAGCLERGGLYLEAIELYKELNRDEKVGDLYKTLKQDENAGLFYEKYISTKLSQNDYLDAARIIDEKLEQRERAGQLLLEGWCGSYQNEPCLKKYFDIELEKGNNSTERRLQEIFANHTPTHKQLSLLNVLEHINRKSSDTSLNETTLQIAYEIINGETERGNAPALHSLKKFLAGDRLIGADASRYNSHSRKKPASTKSSQIFHLAQDIMWKKAVSHRNQFVVLGIKDSFLHLARGNWYGNIEYYSWNYTISDFSRFTVINSPYYDNHLIVHAFKSIMPVTRKDLQKNKYFPEALVVDCPLWLHAGTPLFVINEAGNICKLHTTEDTVTLHQYTINGHLEKSVNCIFKNEAVNLHVGSSNPQLVHHDGYYYTNLDNYFIVISENGLIETFPSDTIIRFFSASNPQANFRLVVSTYKGCLLYTPSAGNLNKQGGYFAAAHTPSLISFIASDFFIMAEKNKAFLFEIVDGLPRQIQEFETQSTIIGAISTNRHQFALVEKSGVITICEINSFLIQK